MQVYDYSLDTYFLKNKADGAYKPSDELRAAGALPQCLGERRRAIKFKSWTV